VALSAALVLAGCTSDTGASDTRANDGPDGGEHDAAPPQAAGQFEALPRVATTNGGDYRVAWRSIPDPIPENEPFQLLVRLEKSAGSGPVAAELGLQVGAWMPSHQHGMTRRPLVRRLENGCFSVEGLLLHMAGEWQLQFDLLHAGRIERAVFDVALLPPPATQALEGFDPDDVGRILALSPLPPAPDDPTNAHDQDGAAARLGQFLFFDARLSASGSVACASCHVPELGWSDGKPLADVGTPLARHTMSLWNVAYGRWFFWDGRADSLWSQALHPLEDAREHASDRVSIARLFLDDAELRRAYTEVFGPLPDLSDRLPARGMPVPGSPDDPLAAAWNALDDPDREAVERVFSDVGKAIAAFEREIVTGDSPFDVFVAGLRDGDPARIDVLSAAARRGLKLFLGKANCHACHAGPEFTDREFHDNRAPSRPELPADRGRMQGIPAVLADVFNGLGPYSDGHDPDSREKLERTVPAGRGRSEFKTPTLRNVARTAPYMHQGQLATLAEVIDFYSDAIPPPPLHGERVLTRLHLSAEEKADLLAFLESLSSPELPPELMRQPASPCAER